MRADHRAPWWCVVGVCLLGVYPGVVNGQRWLPIEPPTPSVAHIKKLLKTPISMQGGRMTLADFVQLVRQRYEVNIRIDVRELEDAGLTPNVPLHLSPVRAIRFKSFLNSVLEPVDLTWIIKSEWLVITTPEEAENGWETRLYLVGDLVGQRRATSGARAEAKIQQNDYDRLIRVITSSIACDTWDDVGGSGTIIPFPASRTLVISQTPQVHEQIAALLDSLGKAGQLQDRADGSTSTETQATYRRGHSGPRAATRGRKTDRGAESHTQESGHVVYRSTATWGLAPSPQR